jgi:hypothetical protein
MAGDPKHPLSPDSVAARVAEILSAAERDAREIIEEALREASLIHQLPAEGARHQHGSEAAAGEPTLASFTDTLASLTESIASLAARVDGLEAAIDTWLTAPPPGPAAEVATGAVLHAPSAQPLSPDEPHSSAGGLAGAERIRAVDLALRGYSRVQIASELRSSMGSDAIEQLLDEVLERA